MNKMETILKCLNRDGFHSQRKLARQAGFSLGSVNELLKKMVEKGFLSRGDRDYQITELGNTYLEECGQRLHAEKLSIKKGDIGVRTAVILAAGENKEFAVPTGLLIIDGVRVIDYLLRYLHQTGIERIILIVGAMQEQYLEHMRNKQVEVWENPHYKWSGTMASLAVVEKAIREDFLLIESNLIFEQTILKKVLDAPYANCILVASPSGSGDEAYVELSEDGTVKRISKDIRQLNRIDGEMLGISKISYTLFQKMLEYYKKNTNPMLNYEYVIEYIGRLYGIYGVRKDDLAWALIESQEQYEKAKELVFPRIKKKEIGKKEQHARALLKQSLGVAEEEVEQVSMGGGMTNTNYFATVGGEEYILRIPGACTDAMIDRRGEAHNGGLATTLGINPETIYFDQMTGVKITKCIPGARTLNGKTARLESSIQKTTEILRKLHQSDMKMYGSFSVEKEYEKYKQLLNHNDVMGESHYQEADDFFYRMSRRLQEIGLMSVPCHNDLVAENFVEDVQGKMYLIDWEYAGYYDPAWDLASHLLECEFLPVEEELFLKYYAPEGISRACEEKIFLFKICQDILWSVWTLLKEAGGEDFGSYGVGRLKRAIQMKKEYIKRYGEI